MDTSKESQSAKSSNDPAPTARQPWWRKIDMPKPVAVDMIALLSTVGLAQCALAIIAMGSGAQQATALTGLLLSGVAGWVLLRKASMAMAASKQLHAKQDDTYRAARIDSLTGLPNRLTLRQHLEAALARDPHEPTVVMFADLDRFKEVNDGLGHDAGDALLIEVARRFGAAIGPGDILARLGGDEFAAVLTGSDAVERSEAIAARFVGSIEDTLVVRGDTVSVGVSIGISSDVSERLSSEELLRRADIAMYRAKAEQGCSFRTFTAEMDQGLILKRTLRSELETARRDDQLRLDLQPIFCARTGNVVSAEALMRWRHPERGEIPPTKFIPMAEEGGQIIELGEWAVDRVIECVKQLGDIPIAVNVSPAQFRRQAFAKMVADKLLQADVQPALLKIEITEGVLITHRDAAMRTIRQLRDIGVKVVLDDFGTGFSSLSYLQSFDFDAVKIDRSFVRDLGGKQQSTQLTRAIIDMGHGLGMEVVAEGIENSRQASLLQLLGCDHLQGFYLGVPADLATLRRRAKQGPPSKVIVESKADRKARPA